MAKKLFPCGHRGRGKYCHRCEQEAQQKASTQDQKEAWEALFDKDPIDLRILQHKSVIKKARKIIKAIANGESYYKFKGKRMNHDRTIISVPINRDYRLIYHDTDNGLVLGDLLSHEAYNIKKPGER